MTTTSWTDSAKQQGGNTSEKIPAGQQDNLKISKVIFGNKQGKYQSKDGDPQILVIVKDDQDREASGMFTLGEKSKWAIARLCEACGMDLAKMDKSGIPVTKFADETFATKNLEGRTLSAQITHTDKYANFAPLPKPSGQEDEIPL